MLINILHFRCIHVAYTCIIFETELIPYPQCDYDLPKPLSLLTFAHLHSISTLFPQDNLALVF